jgi:outer membrane biosynthesis protein TonB
MAIPLTLKVFKNGTLVTSHGFERDIIKIGRLSSAHLRLEDEKVSRVHSVIEVAAGGALSIIDMGSVEGTYVNGKRVTKSRISFGDEIRLGETTLRLENPATVAAVNLSAAVSSAEILPQAPVVLEPAATPVQEAAVAVDTAPVPAPAPAQEAEPPPPVRTVRRSKRSGPMGVSLSFVWGDQRVGEFFLPPGAKRSFSVGTAAGVDFVMGDSRLGSPRLEVLRTDGQTYTVCFTGKMKGELIRGAETLGLEAIIESGRASHEDPAYTLALEPDDVFWADLGGVTMEVCFQPVPKRVHVPLSDSVDYQALNIFLLMLFASSMFVIGALNRTGGGDAFSDELNGDTTRLTKLIIKPPEPQKNRFLAQLNEQKTQQQKPIAQASEPVKKPRRDPGQQVPSSSPSNPKDKAQRMVKDLFGGPGKSVAALFGPPGKNNDLRNAISNVNAMVGGPGSLTGLVTKTGPGGPGGPGGSTIGLGGIFTPGRAGGNDDYGKKVPGLTSKESVDPTIAPVEFKINEGSLDRELVRKVIQDNKGQIRACFESLLNQYPDLNGKVQTQFTIGPQGQVLESKVTQTTTGSKELDVCVASRVRLWQFPKPKGGGIVVVSYPFLFKQAGR